MTNMAIERNTTGNVVSLSLSLNKQGLVADEFMLLGLHYDSCYIAHARKLTKLQHFALEQHFDTRLMDCFFLFCNSRLIVILGELSA